MTRLAATERDLVLVRWVGEMYVVPMAVLAELVARESPVTMAPDSAARVARRQAARLEQLGYADRRPMLGAVWVAPTRRGLRAAGLQFRAWNIDEHALSLAHVEACARLRLALEATYPDGRWESDRQIRQRWHGSGARVRLADGGLYWPEGGATGIELERHIKHLDRYAAAVADCDPAWSAGVWWFTPSAQVALLQQRLQDAGAGAHHQVVEAPEGVAS